MNRADNEAGTQAVDSLINFETVKVSSRCDSWQGDGCDVMTALGVWQYDSMKGVTGVPSVTNVTDVLNDIVLDVASMTSVTGVLCCVYVVIGCW